MKNYLSEIKKARERIRKLIVRTPCVYSPVLSKRTGKKVFLKLENLQLTGAFKIRGNANKIALLKRENKKGVITASSGNHGLGLSCAALKNGITAIVVLPQTAPRNKVEKIQANKAKVIIHGKSYEQASEYAHFWGKEIGYTYIPSFDDEEIIAGNGSIALEILEDVPDIEMIVFPVGGGGGISGVCLATKEIKSTVQVIGTKAEKAASTFASGIAVKELGKLNSEIIRHYVDGMFTISEEEMKRAITILAEDAKIIAEGAGAAPVAALLFNKFSTRATKIALVISGGNIDMDFNFEASIRGGSIGIYGSRPLG